MASIMAWNRRTHPYLGLPQKIASWPLRFVTLSEIVNCQEYARRPKIVNTINVSAVTTMAVVMMRGSIIVDLIAVHATARSIIRRPLVDPARVS